MSLTAKWGSLAAYATEAAALDVEMLGMVALKMEVQGARVRGEKETQINQGWCNFAWLLPGK